jgi:hypothetical protein
MGVEKMAPIEELKPRAHALVTQSHAAARSSPLTVSLPSTRIVTSSRDHVALSRFLHIPIDQPTLNLHKSV